MVFIHASLFLTYLSFLYLRGAGDLDTAIPLSYRLILIGFKHIARYDCVADVCPNFRFVSCEWFIVS